MEHKLDIDEYASRVKVYEVLENLGQITVGRLITEESLSEDEIASVASLFKPWKSGESVTPPQLREYDNQLYQCAQAHTTQADWTPDVTPALWVKVSAPGTIPAWVQPTGAHDAYAIDDMVTHDGQTWKSTIAANTTVPGENTAFGWWVEVTD